MPKILASLVTITALVLASSGEASAQTAYKTGERTTGMTKQCFYDRLGSQYTRTVRMSETCPLSIEVAPAPVYVAPAPVYVAPAPRTNVWTQLGRSLDDLGAARERQQAQEESSAREQERLNLDRARFEFEQSRAQAEALQAAQSRAEALRASKEQTAALEAYLALEAERSRAAEAERVRASELERARTAALEAVLEADRRCDSQDMSGCVDLGSMHAEGSGVVRSDTRAVALFRRACNGGEMRGCAELGSMYAEGSGVVRSDTRAVALFRRACNGGNTGGCERLAWAERVRVAAREAARERETELAAERRAVAREAARTRVAERERVAALAAARQREAALVAEQYRAAALDAERARAVAAEQARAAAEEAARQARRAATRSTLVVTSDQPGQEVLLNGEAVGRTPLNMPVDATTNATVALRRGGWQQEHVLAVPPQTVVRVAFQIPRDTLPWPIAKSISTIMEEHRLNEQFRPTTSPPQAPQGPPPRRSRGRSIGLAVSAGVAGIVVGAANGQSWCPHQGYSEACGVYVGAFAAAVGYYAGEFIDKGRVTRYQRRAAAYRTQYAAWEVETGAERDRWIEQQLGPLLREEGARVAQEVARVRLFNSLTLQANSALGPPTVTIGQ